MSDLVAAAALVGPIAAAHADESESARRLAAPVVDALRDAQLLRMCVPAIYGGPETSPLAMARAIEIVAQHDGAAGWCTMIASTTSSLSTYLTPEWARTIFADPKVVAGGVFARNATAEAVDGGFRVSGRWMWGSGTQHCQWITGGAVDAEGVGRGMFFPAADVTIHDTWHTSGLRGTGSNDFSVDGAFVPEGCVVRPELGPVVDVPLGAFPNMTLLAIGVAAVSLGIGRHALDALIELAQEKRPQFSQRTIAQNGVAQSDLARAEASLRSARAFFYDEVDQAWALAAAGSRVPTAARVRIRLAGAHAAEAVAKVADLAYTLGGGTAIFDASPLQRCMRDAHVVTQHIMVAPRLYETLGKAMFGQEIDASML